MKNGNAQIDTFDFVALQSKFRRIANSICNTSHLHIPDVSGGPTVTMAILARLGVNIAANIGFQYAAEMLPTVVRAQGVSLIHIIGYFAHIIGPYVIYLVKYLENP